MSRNVIIEDADAVSRAALKKILKKQGFDGKVTVQEADGQVGTVIRLMENGGVTSPSNFTKPVRAGAVLVHVRKLLALENSEIVTFGRHALNVVSHELTQADSGVVRLTEKESHILRLLAEKPGAVISRKVLLEQVWQYAEGIETHTLETHVYRLRQKIEADPAKPTLLLTDNDGYRLAN